MHPYLNRRRFLTQTVAGLGQIALAQMLAQDRLRAAPQRPDINPANPNAARNPHLTPRAKNVLMIFCSGAVSQLDTFDYKPELIKRHGQPMPGAEGLVTFQGQQGNLTQSPWAFRPKGQSGKMVSDLVPHLGALADQMCFIHSLTSKTNTHGPGENFMSTGSTLDAFPSMGSWLSYALGTENETLPAAFQGTDFNATNPLRNLARPAGASPDLDRATREFLTRMNRHHLARFPGDTELAARISSYELAARMQLSVPEVADIANEPAHILKLYGADAAGNPVQDLKAA